MTKKKEKGVGYSVFIGCIVAFCLVALTIIIWAMYCSWENRQFSNAVWVMSNEAKAKAAEYNGVKVRVSDENAQALGTIPMKQKYRKGDKSATVIDSVTFSFSVNQEMWNLCVEQLDNSTCRITLDADRHFQYYFDDNGEFYTYTKLASPEGYVNENKIFEVKGN